MWVTSRHKSKSLRMRKFQNFLGDGSLNLPPGTYLRKANHFILFDMSIQMLSICPKLSVCPNLPPGDSLPEINHFIAKSIIFLYLQKLFLKSWEWGAALNFAQ